MIEDPRELPPDSEDSLTPGRFRRSLALSFGIYHLGYLTYSSKG
jgi:hypothetical protein